MRKRLFIAAVCILALPLLFSFSQNEKLSSSAPFSMVALAGHNVMGGWCECGTPGCIADPGETCFGARAVPDRNGRSRNQGATSAPADRTSGLDFGAGALMLALAFFVWTRFRA